MADEERSDNRSLLDKLIAILSGLPWSDVLGDVWKTLRKVMQGRSYRGMYEVVRYESTLELKDRGGKRATFKKREKVRQGKESTAEDAMATTMKDLLNGSRSRDKKLLP